MQSCLGISITDKYIKYAKVEQGNNTFNVTSYGMKFYDNLELQQTIQQIIEETGSGSTPISVNIKNEKYYYFDIFSMANKEYIKKAIETEFESFCTENHLTQNAYEGRYTYVKDQNNQDQDKVIYIYDNKADLNEITDAFEGAKIVCATPTAIALPNIATVEKGKNTMIVNLNEETKVTTILGQEIYNVDILQQGLTDAFNAINERENSYSKTYERLKNTTIYTMEMATSAASAKTTESDSNEYIQFVVPVLYKIANEIQNLMKSYRKIDQIYLTGIGASINNVDLYFQEYFKQSKVEILKPFFINDSPKINIKDYIEVNSAIALAIQGLGYGIDSLNFKKTDTWGNLKSLLSMDLKDLNAGAKKSIKGGAKGKKTPKKLNLGKLDLGNSNMKGPLSKVEIAAVRDCISVAIIAIIFCVGSFAMKKQLEKNIGKANDVIKYTDEQIASANDDDQKVRGKTTDYKTYKSNLEDTSSAIEKKRSRKNQITTLLNKIVYTIPKQVQLTEIKNTAVTQGDKVTQHITIYAQAAEYEQLAYFKAKIKNDGILQNVVSTDGTKEGGVVKIAIEGDLDTY